LTVVVTFDRSQKTFSSSLLIGLHAALLIFVLICSEMEYQGQILDGQMHGHGKLKYENGEYYDGEWVKGRLEKSLFFSIRLRNDLVLIGKRHGKGEYVYNDGTRFIGMWDSDRIHGEGTSIYPNGNK
jgi:hypothetical protein